ncbi:MAG: hypothetical protein ACRCZQ_10345 [Bacteroidales bacterium]
MGRAYSINEILNTRIRTMKLDGKWKEAFDEPGWTGIWFIWGNSGNGKSSFVMQLCKELARFGKVIYNSLEEGTEKTMQNTLERFDMSSVNKRVQITQERIERFSERLDKQKSPDFAIIDSFQYANMSYKQYQKFKERHRNKLIIFISHADGKQPSGRAAKSVMYDASLKIWVEGYRAFSKGRYIGEKGYIDVWEEGAMKYWGENETVETINNQENGKEATTEGEELREVLHAS